MAFRYGSLVALGAAVMACQGRQNTIASRVQPSACRLREVDFASGKSIWTGESPIGISTVVSGVPTCIVHDESRVSVTFSDGTLDSVTWADDHPTVVIASISTSAATVSFRGVCHVDGCVPSPAVFRARYTCERVGTDPSVGMTAAAECLGS